MCPTPFQRTLFPLVFPSSHHLTLLTVILIQTPYEAGIASEKWDWCISQSLVSAIASRTCAVCYFLGRQASQCRDERELQIETDDWVLITFDFMH